MQTAFTSTTSGCHVSTFLEECVSLPHINDIKSPNAETRARFFTCLSKGLPIPPYIHIGSSDKSLAYTPLGSVYHRNGLYGQDISRAHVRLDITTQEFVIHDAVTEEEDNALFLKEKSIDPFALAHKGSLKVINETARASNWSDAETDLLDFYMMAIKQGTLSGLQVYSNDPTTPFDPSTCPWLFPE